MADEETKSSDKPEGEVESATEQAPQAEGEAETQSAEVAPPLGEAHATQDETDPSADQTPQAESNGEPDNTEVTPSVEEAPVAEEEKPEEAVDVSNVDKEDAGGTGFAQISDQPQEELSDALEQQQSTETDREVSIEIQEDQEQRTEDTSGDLNDSVQANQQGDEEVIDNTGVNEAGEADSEIPHEVADSGAQEAGEQKADNVDEEADHDDKEVDNIGEHVEKSSEQLRQSPEEIKLDPIQEDDDGEETEDSAGKRKEEEKDNEVDVEGASNTVEDTEGAVAPPIVDASQEQEAAADEAEQKQEETADQAEAAAAAAEVQQEPSTVAEDQNEAEAEEVKAGEVEQAQAQETAEEKAPDTATGEVDLGDAARKEASAESEQKQAEDATAQEKEEKEQNSEDEKKQEEEEGEKVEDEDAEKKEEESKEKKEDEGEKEEADEDEEKKKKQAEEEEHTIPENFYYNFEDHASKAVVAQDSGLPLDMLTLQHSYGYDCKKRNNLHLLDESTVVFAAGNVLQILNLKTRSQTYLRSTSGCGIGAICVHPSRKFFAVGEKGDAPNINIFEFPSLKLYRILRGGTEQSYTSLTFSPDGELLATQGGDPDFMLTVWNWRQEKTTLRTKSFSQDVFRVSFAPELEGQLTTAGSGHIRFWKMADTFTGLKLQGELGRFGRTEISDIEGYVELPDGKVLSGAEWGNLLLWDGGLIKVEITTKSKKNCHNGPIMQILLDEGELMTVGSDGFIRVSLDKTVRVFDYVQMKQLAEAKFSAGATTIQWVPLTLEGDHSRRTDKQEAEIVLKQAFKPHNGRVTAMAFDGKGEVLATGSADGTVFFLFVSDVYDPIGFIKVPGAVRQLVWTPEKFKKLALMVVCEDGVVVEVDAPEPGNFDTSHTYEISGLPMREYKFKSIKSHLRHEEELERERIEEEERKKKEEEERRKRIERGLETESEAGDEEVEQKPKTPKPEWHAYIPEEPSPILNASYTEEEGTFWLSMGEFDAGYLYKCKFTSPEEKAVMMPDNIDKPLIAIPVHESNDVPIHIIKYSQSGQRVMFGMANGQIRIQQLEEPHDLAQLGAQWTLSVHDNNYGNITALASSYDGSMLLSAGADGNFFQFNFMDQETMEEKIKENKAKLPSARDLADKVVDDIDDPNAYSIEDAKQKTEYDKRMKEAEQKKRDVRKKINQMRRQFKAILEQNDNMPKHLQLSRQEFEMDKEIKQELHQQTEEKIDLDVVECERIIVRAFTTPHEVISFRASKLSDDFYQLKADFERRKTKLPTKDDFSRDPTRDLGAAQRKLLEGGGLAEDGLEGGPGSKVTTTLKGSMGERVNNALQKVEEKKKKRAARRAQIHEYKYEFNVRLLALRDKKIAAIDQIRDIVTKLKDIQTRLQEDKHLPIPPVPELHADEMPERILEYTREILTQFKIEYDLKQKQAKSQGGGGGGGDGGGFGFGFGGGDSGGAPPAAEKQPSAVSPPPMKQASTLDRAKTLDGEEKEEGEGDNGEKKEEEEEDTMTPLERKIYNIDQIRLAYEQGKLLQDISEIVAKFDAELRILRHDKFRMDIVMKDADLRQVTLFEEFVLLKEYEISEDILAEKLANKQQEKLDMQTKMLEVQGKIDAKKKDIEKLLEKEKALMASFTQSLGENNKFADYLTKVFKKRVKRTKKKMSEDGESDEDSDEDSSDDSDWEESDEESESELGGFDLDVCPPGCDQKLYDDTCTLREKRLDNEEALTEEKKNQEAQKKELESLQKKAKVIDSQLKTAQNDLEDFQLEKQQKLNELTVVSTLKLHQVQHITNGCLHHDLSPTLVFASGGVVRLQHRIKELEHEKLSQKKQMRESRKKHVQLIKDRRIFEAQITDMEETCLGMMLAKFGCMVDLEKIETVTVNRAIEELKEKLRQTEIDCSMELRSYDEEIMRRKERITNLVRDNTQRLTQLAMMLTEQNQYTESLDNRQKKVGADFTGQRKTDVREKQRLIQLVQLQAQEIDALKEEIMLLSRKGGHILPPAQPPLPQSPPNFQPPQGL
ncbi:cilia- and flagella-associated protein 44-like [Plakobranchus ocellatus]|uniref:Cilia- and flagella-associated protein 44 n=1 Tax=Plakobranchus ocellatus TaxID=259542 RepID=A0AAV4AVP8_9GAST|nr:cilia- and flagella-associated protein 44-like [Plakobranchus ocellatus]